MLWAVGRPAHQGAGQGSQGRTPLTEQGAGQAVLPVSSVPSRVCPISLAAKSHAPRKMFAPPGVQSVEIVNYVRTQVDNPLRVRTLHCQPAADIADSSECCAVWIFFGLASRCNGVGAVVLNLQKWGAALLRVGATLRKG